MKHRCLALGLILLAVLTLTGCACEHEWMVADCVNQQICAKCNESGEPALGHDWLDATCTTPETCVRCSETRGEPLGHDWLDATCTAPETCTRCSETQGETLAHSYGDWAFGDELMSHTCSVCNYFEELPIDRELYLESLLDGYWDVWYVDDYGKTERICGHNWINMEDVDDQRNYLYFSKDRTFHIEWNPFPHYSGTWQIVTNDAGNLAIVACTQELGDNEPLLLEVHEDIDGRTAISFTGGDFTMWFYREEDETLDAICSNWIADNSNNFLEYGRDDSHWFQFHPDRTVTFYADDLYEGVWGIGGCKDYAAMLPDNYVDFFISFMKDGKPTHIYGDFVFFASNAVSPEMYISYGSRNTYFTQADNETFEIVRNATDMLVGTWTSIGFGSSNPAYADPATMDYSLTVQVDNKVILSLPDGRTYTGSWQAYNCSDHYYQYSLYFDGLKKDIACILNVKGGDASLGIGESGHDPELFFKQMPEEEFAGPTLPLEIWTFEGAYNGKTGKPADTADCSITFHEDGTFFGQMNQGIRGKWKYYNYDESTVYGSDGSEEVYDSWTYLLYVEGETEPEYIRIEKYKNEEQFRLRIPVTDSDGNRTTYVFNRD